MGEPPEVRPVRILLVEDNPGDVRLVEEAFREAQIANDLDVVSRCEEALDRLHGRGEYAGADRPDVVLSAVHLPDGTGPELVETIREAPALADVPVLLLTASAEGRSVLEDERATGYLTKPLDPNEFVERLLSLESVWIRLVYPTAED